MKWAAASGSSGPSFSAYVGTNQTLSAATLTKLAYNTESWDTDNCYDNATNYRFTPNKAGYYQVNAGVFMYDGPEYRFFLYKNGSTYAFFDIKDDPSDKNPHLQGACLVYCNGSTDYLELYGFMRAASTTRRVDATSTGSWFQAVWIRS